MEEKILELTSDEQYYLDESAVGVEVLVKVVEVTDAELQQLTIMNDNKSNVIINNILYSYHGYELYPHANQKSHKLGLIVVRSGVDA